MSLFPRAPDLGSPGPFRWVRVLGDGRYRILLSSWGTGFSTLDGEALTSDAEDPRLGAPAPQILIRDADDGGVWAVDGRPSPDRIWGGRWLPGGFRSEGTAAGIEAVLEIAVVPGQGTEIRRVTVRNRSGRPRRIEITSAIDPVLNDPRAHAAHPAFSKLFLETEYVSGERCLLVRRRPRDPVEHHPWMFHALVGLPVTNFETDRARFLGRGWPPGIPGALVSGERRPGTAGGVVDPILSLSAAVTLREGESASGVFLIGAAPGRAEALARARDAGSAGAVERGVSAGAAHAEDVLHTIGLSPEDAAYLAALGGAILGGPSGLRSDLAPPMLGAEAVPTGPPPRTPYVVFGGGDRSGEAVAAAVIASCRYWKAIGLPILTAVVADRPLPSSDPDEDGYVLIRPGESSAEQLEEIDRGARLVLRHGFPDLRDLGGGRREERALPLPGDPASTAIARKGDAPAPPSTTTLRFDNGTGGFTPEGTEYVIRVSRRNGRTGLPPRPWTNVVANEGFGFLISETGAGFTWKGNSREHRLTPWSNDPVLDPHGEATYLRDEETGEIQSLFPGPCPGAADYEIRHGLGYTVSRVAAGDLDLDTCVFVPRGDPVKVTRVRIANRGDRVRRLSVVTYHRLVIGSTPEETAPNVVTGFDAAAQAVIARNLVDGESARPRVFAALSASGSPRGFRFTGDRRGFLGAGDLSRPAGLSREAVLDGRTGSGLDPCIVEQLELEIGAGSSATVVSLLGEGEGIEEVRALIARYREPDAAERALAEVRDFWDQELSGVRIRTPMPDLDILVNRWLPYQVLSCRLWARSAFHQSGGAFGYRDQLQDALALVHLSPERTRAQILLHAAHQFEEGDVLHWWHPPGNRGLRTRFADDAVWLAYVVADYVAGTGDRGILEETAPFVRARALEPGEDEAYLHAEPSSAAADVYEHCCRAVDRALTRGEHGLPLFGTGDWNDGMNRVGREGRGESVWMAFFLHAVLGAFLPLCRERGDDPRIRRYEDYRSGVRIAANDWGWDGAWYRRGSFDDGTPLGSAASRECRIDALAQAWAVLSGAAPPERARRAMAAVQEHLVSERDGIIRLLTPPFDTTPHDPGYIRGYLPGVRENGGQYTHAALWVAAAAARLGWNDRAAHLLGLLNPIRHTGTEEAVRTYQGEPYVVAADVYGEPSHVGRAGWTWYTGSAGWMIRVALESILGIRLREGRVLDIRPCVPDEWPEFSVRYRLPGEETVYEIRAVNPEGSARRVAGATLDGEPVPIDDEGAHLPLLHDGGRHRVEVVLGGDGDPPR